MMARVAATAEMCAFCFDSLAARLNKQEIGTVLERFRAAEPLADTVFPLFVTWKIGRNRDLRGCVGTFAANGPLSDTLQRYALIAAIEDDRFEPIQPHEVEHLQVGVSLLTNFREIEDPYDWIVGTHGIELEIKEGKRRYRGTYLPEVAQEQGWNQATTYVHLFRKAGYSPRNPQLSAEEIVAEVQSNLKVRSYESSKHHMTFPEYVTYRNVGKN